MVDEIAMQTQLQLKRQMDRRNRSSSHILRIENDNVIPQHIQSIDEPDQPTFSFSPTLLWNERRFLERGPRTCPVDVFLLIVPCVVRYAIEQPTCRRPTGSEVVLAGRVSSYLPEMVVLLREESVVDSAELSAGAPFDSRFDSILCVGGIIGISRGVWVEYPAAGVAVELVALQHRASGRIIGREEEEDVAVCNGKVVDDVAIGVFVATCCVAMES